MKKSGIFIIILLLIALIGVNSMFTAMYEEYARDPEITRSRMYYEAISDILPGVKLFINTANGEDVQMLLPLESLVDTAETTEGGNQ